MDDVVARGAQGELDPLVCPSRQDYLGVGAWASEHGAHRRMQCVGHTGTFIPRGAAAPCRSCGAADNHVDHALHGSLHITVTVLVSGPGIMFG